MVDVDKSTLDEALLLAYVDGHLPPEQAEAVRVSLHDNTEAAAFVEQLRIVPGHAIRDAFDEDVDPQRLSGLKRRILDNGGVSVIPSPRHASRTPQPKRRVQQRWLPLALAATVSLVVGLSGGWFVSEATRTPQPAEGAKNWMEQVAEYQKLYGRPTITANAPSAGEITATEAKLAGHFGASISVPDLTLFGLSFKRGQILFSHGNPIIQLVYLPVNGEPVALCLIRTPHQKKPVTPGRLEGLNYATWRDHRVEYLLIGDVGQDLLMQSAQTIAKTSIVGS